MTTAEKHEHDLLKIPFKHGQRVYYLGLHDIVCGTIDCINIKLSARKTEFEYTIRIESASGSISYKKVYSGDESNMSNDPLPLIEKWLLRKISSLDEDKRRYEKYLEENESLRKQILAQYESLKKQFCL